MNKIDELLEEIQAICIGADSPDAIKRGKKNKSKELEYCRKDIAAISNIIEEIQEIRKKGEKNEVQDTRH